jgi:hypothetical protein
MSDDSAVLLPAMPCHQTEADQLASSHVAGPDNCTTVGTVALRGMRWSIALGQAVANVRCAGQAAGRKG